MTVPLTRCVALSSVRIVIASVEDDAESSFGAAMSVSPLIEVMSPTNSVRSPGDEIVAVPRCTTSPEPLSVPRNTMTSDDEDGSSSVVSNSSVSCPPAPDERLMVPV